jgi:transcriptional regulator of aromatic amino acid metabolism
MMRTYAALESPSMLELAPEEVILGRSSTMSILQRGVEKVVVANIPLVLQSESNTGKEWLGPLCGHMDEPIGDFGWLDRVF